MKLTDLISPKDLDDAAMGVGAPEPYTPAGEAAMDRLRPFYDTFVGIYVEQERANVPSPMRFHPDTAATTVFVVDVAIQNATSRREQKIQEVIASLEHEKLFGPDIPLAEYSGWLKRAFGGEIACKPACVRCRLEHALQGGC